MRTFTFTIEELERVLGNALDLYEDERKEYSQDAAPARALVIEGIRDSLIEWGNAPLFSTPKKTGRQKKDE